MKAILLICLILTSVICDEDFKSTEYQSQSRFAKLDSIWSAVIRDTNSRPFPPFIRQGGLMFQDMDVSMNLESDKLPEGRIKNIHVVGVVGKAEFIPEPDNGYPGFFKGADSLLLRFSLNIKPDYSKKAYDNFTPGLGLKFLIDGKPSANLVAMFSVNGVYSYNFFDQDMNTHIPDPKGFSFTWVAQKFSTATDVVGFVGLKKFSEYNQDGSMNQDAKFPFKLSFRAPKNIKEMFTENYTVDFRETFKKMPPHTTILEVYATDDPETGCQKKVGTIKTTSIFTTSKFGDESLMFQHLDFQKDLDARPDWKDFTPYWSLFQNHGPKKPEGKCPYASLFS